MCVGPASTMAVRQGSIRESGLLRLREGRGEFYGNNTVTPLGCGHTGANVPTLTEMSAAGGTHVKLFRAVIGMVVLGLLTNGTASAQAIAGSQLPGRGRARRGRDPGGGRDRHETRHRRDPNRVHGCRWLVRAAESSGRALSAEGRPAGL